MPEISRFLGIIIMMFYDEHAPPHFHARYGEYDISVTIDDGEVKGNFPARALRLVLEWHAMHRKELLQNWAAALKGDPLKKIPPLE